MSSMQTSLNLVTSCHSEYKPGLLLNPEKADNVARNHSKHVKPLVQRNRLHELCLCCHTKIKGPDNPTNQLLPMITSRCENEMGKAGRKGDGARQVGSVKEVCVCVCDSVVCVCVSLCM